MLVRIHENRAVMKNFRDQRKRLENVYLKKIQIYNFLVSPRKAIFPLPIFVCVGLRPWLVGFVSVFCRSVWHETGHRAMVRDCIHLRG